MLPVNVTAFASAVSKAATLIDALALVPSIDSGFAASSETEAVSIRSTSAIVIVPPAVRFAPASVAESESESPPTIENVGRSFSPSTVITIWVTKFSVPSSIVTSKLSEKLSPSARY